MTLAALMNRPCTITLRSTSTDEGTYGDLEDSETTVETVCELQQVKRDEPPTAGELSVTVWNVFFPPGTAADTASSVDVEGAGVFEFTGDPWSVRDPRTQVDLYVWATVKRVGPSEVGS